ncbi:MAG: hypothetical protein IJN10_04015 [Firmicutes bacterium]|nr:hypothetical protein [Bacillota bacterium]
MALICGMLGLKVDAAMNKYGSTSGYIDYNGERYWFTLALPNDGGTPYGYTEGISYEGTATMKSSMSVSTSAGVFWSNDGEFTYGYGGYLYAWVSGNGYTISASHTTCGVVGSLTGLTLNL